jgi:hypothetical protein
VRPALWPCCGQGGHRWGKTKGKVGFHGGKVEIERPRVRACDGGEISLRSWETAMSEDLLGKWALNLMLINVSTRRFGRAVRLPEGDISAAKGTGVFQVGGVASVRGARRYVRRLVDLAFLSPELVEVITSRLTPRRKPGLAPVAMEGTGETGLAGGGRRIRTLGPP